jgi:hypothetical protein
MTKAILISCGLIALSLTSITNATPTSPTNPCPSTQSMQVLLTQIQAGQFKYYHGADVFVGYHIKKAELRAAGVPTDIVNAPILKNGGKVILQVLRKHAKDNVQDRAPGYSLANDPGIYETLYLDDTSITACDYSYDLNGAPDGTAFLIAGGNA